MGNVSAFFSSTMRRNTPTEMPTEALSSAPSTTDQTPHKTTLPAIDQEDQPMIKGAPPVVHGPADPAHNDMSYFHAAHRSWMRHYPASLTIQLHGFKQITDIPERQFDMILSSGQIPQHQSTFFLESERILTQCFPDKKLGVFGRDTTILGGLTNVQGTYLNRYTSGVFWHLEMTREFRKSLKKTSSIKTRFFNCINQIMDAYEL